MAGAHLRQHLMRVQHTLDQHLDLPPAFLAAKQTRLDDARIVQYQHIVRPDQLQQVGEAAILQCAIMRIQQAARAALTGRMLRDQSLGQNKIEFIGTHGHNRKNHEGGIVVDVRKMKGCAA